MTKSGCRYLTAVASTLHAPLQGRRLRPRFAADCHSATVPALDIDDHVSGLRRPDVDLSVEAQPNHGVEIRRGRPAGVLNICGARGSASVWPDLGEASPAWSY